MIVCPIVTQEDIIIYDCFNLWCYRRPRSQRPSHTASPAVALPMLLSLCNSSSTLFPLWLCPRFFPETFPTLFSQWLFSHCFPSGSSHTVSLWLFPHWFPWGSSNTVSHEALSTVSLAALPTLFPLQLFPHCFPHGFPPFFSLWLFMLYFPCGSSRIVSPVALLALFHPWLFPDSVFPMALPTVSLSTWLFPHCFFCGSYYTVSLVALPTVSPVALPTLFSLQLFTF